MKHLLSIPLALIIILSTTPLHATEYKVDEAHSSVNFEISHLVVSTVRGKFDDFKGSFRLDDKGRLTGIEGIVTAKSIDTNEKDRDKHLRSKDFFETAKFPQLRLSAKDFRIRKGRTGSVTADLTIRDVTKPVKFKVEYKGTVTDPWGTEKASIEAKATIKRKDFGLTWNKTLDQGGVMIGEEVDIELFIQGNKVEAKTTSEPTASKKK